MAKLFEEIFTSGSSGDVELELLDDDEELRPDSPIRLRCHSLILMQHPYFCKMLRREQLPLREGRTREVRIVEPRDEFLELIRFMYTGQVIISRDSVLIVLSLADKYCIDEVVDICLKHINDTFDADMFYNCYALPTTNSAVRARLTEQFIKALMYRVNLCSITWDPRWCKLPIEVVEAILSQDDLPVSSEAEVLTLVTQWLGQDKSRSRQDVSRLMATCRRSENSMVSIPDLVCLTRALGMDIFSSKVPRAGFSVWDPDFVILRHEAAVPQQQGSEVERLKCETGEILFQLGSKDVLHQEPGWTYPDTHLCRVTLTCASWSHRERRVLRGSPGGGITGGMPGGMSGGMAPVLHPKCSRERSPSPPANYQVRLAPRETNVLDGTEQVDHQIICGVACGMASGNQRHGVRVSQREKNAIYLVEDLHGKQEPIHIGGTTLSVSFDLELLLGEASKCDIRRCRFAVLRGRHRLSEEWFDVSAKVAVRLYFSSSCFDKNSTYCISVKWRHPPNPDG